MYERLSGGNELLVDVAKAETSPMSMASSCPAFSFGYFVKKYRLD
jgi:hypothetical protein